MNRIHRFTEQNERCSTHTFWLNSDDFGSILFSVFSALALSRFHEARQVEMIGTSVNDVLCSYVHKFLPHLIAPRSMLKRHTELRFTIGL